MLSMIGDGATNQGTFGETMNLAALWKLPVVFLIINNQFGMGTALERHSAVTDLSRKSEGFGVPGTRCDGMDVLDVHSVVSEALRSAREERKPQLVEAVTYRYRGHSMADPEEYRTKEEVEEWRKRDPIATFSQAARGRGRAEARRTSRRSTRRRWRPWTRRSKFADNSPVPRPRLPLRRRVRATAGDVPRLVDRGRALARDRTAASASARPARCRTSWPRRAPPTRRWATPRSAGAAAAAQDEGEGEPGRRAARKRAAPTDGRDALPRGAEPGAARGDGGRRVGLHHGRGHRASSRAPSR